MKNNFRFLAFFVLFCMVQLTAQKIDYSQLCDHYVKNNVAVKELQVKMQQAQLDQKKSTVENGVSVTVSTGTIRAEFSDQTVVSANPEVSVEIPALNNTTVTGKVPFSVSTATDKSSSIGSNGTAAGLSVSTGIVTGITEKRNVALLIADRSVADTELRYRNACITAQKEFAQKVLLLFDYISKILDAKDDLIGYEKDLLEVSVKGYSRTSAKYRSAELKVASEQRSLQDLIRTYYREYAIFLEKCGSSEFLPDISDLLAAEFATEDETTTAPAAEFLVSLLPSDIPEEPLLSFSSFSESDFVELRDSKWTYYINSLSRSAEKPFLLNGVAGWEYDGEQQDSGGTHSVTAGIETSYKGFTANTGVVLPLNGSNPGVTFSFGWSPSTGTLYDISTKAKEYSVQLELLAIESAQESFRTQKISFDQKRSDLLWSIQSTKEEFAVYDVLRADSIAGWNQGVITNQDYLQAINDYYQSSIKMLTAKIHCIVYNFDISVLFATEGVK